MQKRFGIFHDVRGQRGFGDGASVEGGEGVEDGVFKFSYVAGPGIVVEDGFGLAVQLGRGGGVAQFLMERLADDWQ